MAKKKKLKIGINSLISWGASVVIIGLMFKILYLPGGEWMIGLGLATEAVLFFILGFQAENEDPDWTRVYPELDEQYAGELPKASLHLPVAASSGHTAALDKMLQDAKISPDLIGKLGDGLRTFSEKVSSISNVADASLATNEFTGKLRSASAGFEKLNTAFEKASVDLVGIGNSSIDTDAYHQQIHKLAKNLESLNAIYEIELRESSSHFKSMNQHYDGIATSLKNFNESAEDTKKFKENVSDLNRNLSSLNAVYGNMLAAMNQPRV